MDSQATMGSHLTKGPDQEQMERSGDPPHRKKKYVGHVEKMTLILKPFVSVYFTKYRTSNTHFIEGQVTTKTVE